MSTYTQIIYHIIFGTYNRERTLWKEQRPELFKYITGILKNNECHLYRINGIEDHLHIITHLHPTIALADLIHDIKLSTREYIKDTGLFRRFDSWQEGYGAFTYSINEKDNLIEYVINQEDHHKKLSFREEYISLLKEHGIQYAEKYLF